MLLGAVLDEKVKHFLLQLRKKGGVVNTVAAAATAKALTARSSDEHLFVQPLLQNQKFQNWLNEKRNYFYNIKVEKYVIPHSMIWNFDQTPSKFAHVSNRTLDIRGTSHIAIAGMSYIKQNFSGTFFETKFCIRYCLPWFTLSSAI